MDQTPSTRPWTTSRRAFLGGVIATGVLAACGESDDTSGDSPSTAADEGSTGDTADAAAVDAEATDSDDGGALPAIGEVEQGSWVLVQRFPQSTQVPGALRLPMSISTGAAEFIQDGPDELRAQVFTFEGEPIGDEIVATKRVTAPAPYYDFRPTVDEPGFFRLAVEGGPPEGATFDVVAAEMVTVPVPGETLEGFDTPTVDDDRGVDPICTRDPECPFHDQTLTAALDGPKAVAYYVGTPAFCQTQTCGPGLDALIAVQPDYADTLDIVHAEVYTDNTATAIAPAVEAVGLAYEPVLIITDPDGVVVDRLDAVFDETELRETLDRALA